MERYQMEFPDFGELDVDLPDDWIDESWHNDTCPRWRVDGTDLYVLIDYEDPTKREVQGESRFAVYEHSDDGERSEDLALTDDWLDVLECVALYLEGLHEGVMIP